MEITLTVSDGINERPVYPYKKGTFDSITKCLDCKSVGLYWTKNTSDPCRHCGGTVVNAGAGKWDGEKWLIRQSE